MDLDRQWNEDSKRGIVKDIAFGQRFKLVDLLAKRVCASPKIPVSVLQMIIPFLHVPLENFTILAVKNLVKSFPNAGRIGAVPSNPSMGSIKGAEMYEAFQEGIRELAKEDEVPPIAVDLLAWDKAH